MIEYPVRIGIYHHKHSWFMKGEVMRKRLPALALCGLLALSMPSFADQVAQVVSATPGTAGNLSRFGATTQALVSFFNAEIQRGHLKTARSQNDPLARMEHRRHNQFFQGIPVFGGEIIYHFRKGMIESINGVYYPIENCDTQVVLSTAEAAGIFRRHLEEKDLTEKTEDTRLLLYPVSANDIRPTYQITLEKEQHYSMTGIIDARSGEILLEYSNIHFDDPAIGLGVGYHGATFKLPTTLTTNGIYGLYDEARIRPVKQYTVDYRNMSIPGDNDNYWDRNGVAVCAHVFIGFTYDFYYGFFDREGINDNNLDTFVFVQNNKYRDNAFWNGESLNFCITGSSNKQYAAALDIVAHEYSHGVTSYSSNLIYSFESGALNESFSDIMGTVAEFYWFPQGNGLYHADWYIGEDAGHSYNINKCRNLANPNSNSQLGDWRYPDPCHLRQKINCSSSLDNGGVHLNMTIYSHAFYLLAHGGRNKVSGITVPGIGIEKAARIFYRAWVFYLTRTSNFQNAANALLTVAYTDYGANSSEYNQTVRTMQAIGWTVN